MLPSMFPIAPQHAYTTTLEPRACQAAHPSTTTQLASVRVTWAAAVDKSGEDANILWSSVRFLTPEAARDGDLLRVDDCCPVQARDVNGEVGR